MNFAHFDNLLTGRSRDGKNIANNTRAVRREGSIAIRLHGTDVVTYAPDGSLTFNTGGYNTLTTRDRMNTFSPNGYRVWTVKGVPHVSSPTGKAFRLHDGITFGPRGGCRNPLATAVTSKVDKADAALLKRIDKFIDGWIESAVTGQMPLPSGGDCWYCCGMISSGGDHLRDHIEESYYVPSLIVLAVKEKGYHNPGVAVQFVMGLRVLEGAEHFDATRADVGAIRGLLRWYLRRELRPTAGIARSAPRMSRA